MTAPYPCKAAFGLLALAAGAETRTEAARWLGISEQRASKLLPDQRDHGWTVLLAQGTASRWRLTAKGWMRLSLVADWLAIGREIEAEQRGEAA